MRLPPSVMDIPGTPGQALWSVGLTTSFLIVMIWLEIAVLRLLSRAIEGDAATAGWSVLLPFVLSCVIGVINVIPAVPRARTMLAGLAQPDKAALAEMQGPVKQLLTVQRSVARLLKIPAIAVHLLYGTLLVISLALYVLLFIGPFFG